MHTLQAKILKEADQLSQNGEWFKIPVLVLQDLLECLLQSFFFVCWYCVPRFGSNSWNCIPLCLQALQSVGSKVRQRATWGKSRTKVEEARELLAGVMLAHVPVILNNFFPTTNMLRLLQCLEVIYQSSLVPSGL